MFVCSNVETFELCMYNNPNYLNFSKKKIKSDLPYFGVAQMSNYNSPGGIIFELEDPEVIKEFNDKKLSIIFKFSAKNGNEAFNCTLTLYKNDTATFSVFSSHRDNISYDGNITFKELE